VRQPAAPSLTWVGHSTVLIEANGTRLLTDPLLRPRVAHLRRVAGSAAALDDELDAVLVSHVHYDHLDLPSLESLRAKRFVVPRGAAGSGRSSSSPSTTS
jgi:L-ascorbate metabolism protein UlaG (beta-lactamase superfamily)